MVLLLAAQFRLLHHVELSLFPAADDLIRARYQHRPGRSQIYVQQIQDFHVGGSKPIHRRQVGIQLDQAAAELLPADGSKLPFPVMT